MRVFSRILAKTGCSTSVIFTFYKFFFFFLRCLSERTKIGAIPKMSDLDSAYVKINSDRSCTANDANLSSICCLETASVNFIPLGNNFSRPYPLPFVTRLSNSSSYLTHADNIIIFPLLIRNHWLFFCVQGILNIVPIPEHISKASLIWSSMLWRKFVFVCKNGYNITSHRLIRKRKSRL